jgi:hypothetical protein
MGLEQVKSTVGLRAIYRIDGILRVYMISTLSNLYSVRHLLVTLLQKLQGGNIRVAGETVIRAEGCLIILEMLTLLNSVSLRPRPLVTIHLETSISVNAGLVTIQIVTRWEMQGAANQLVERARNRFIRLHHQKMYLSQNYRVCLKKLDAQGN